MEIPIQVAVRIFPCLTNEEPCIQSISSPHTLPYNCSQSELYDQTVYPLISLFLEGYDVSVVTYGQKGTGKTYTLLGHGIFSEAEQGVIQRYVRDIYAQLTNQSRSYAINIGWVEIIGEEVIDLLKNGRVMCQTVIDVLRWLEIGLTNKSNQNDSHNIFTITLEQQWISPQGLIQHRLSTASFSDLCGTERMFMLNSVNQHPKDLGLQALEIIINQLTDTITPTTQLIYNNNNNNEIQYNQTTLTTLLKNSFGGRAKTLLMLSVSPLERDINETIYNLQFAFKAQCIRNYVIMNTFSDNNTPISAEIAPEMQTDPTETFELQFAASQWLKLVSNAEGLFAKLLSNKSVNDIDREQIEEWLFLKQECEECLSSSEVIRSEKQLGPIPETEEPDETVSDPETSCYQENSDNESDSELQHPDLEEKIDVLIADLKIKTDNLVRKKYDDFIKSQPKAVMESNESFRPDERRASSSIGGEGVGVVGGGGRRRSIQPGAMLSSAEIARLNRVATREPLSKSSDDFLDSSVEYPIRVQNTPIENLQTKIRKIDADIEAKQRQIKELEHTVSLITDLIKNNDTRTRAKQRFNKKRGKLETEYEKTKKQLSKAVVNGKDKQEIERLKALTSQMEQRLQDLASIKHIAGSESGQKMKELKQSEYESKKQLESLQKNLKKERKIKDQLELELKNLKEKDNNTNSNNSKTSSMDEKSKNLKQVQARITHLDHVLKEKSQNLEKFKNTEEQDGLRHEIRNLRRTRDHLLEQRCTLDRKLKKEKILSHREERKLLECDEAIEAIDAAIEFKNELICGRKSIDTNERLQREKGEQMLMERLNTLSPEEMRTLLYKYFIKVIDLRDSSRKLEMQLMSLERERDAWEWRERVLSNAVRQARLEGERNAVLLQRQHETKLTLMLRHLADETSASSSFNDLSHHRMPYSLSGHHHHQQHILGHAPPTSPFNGSDSEFDMDLCKPHAAAVAAVAHQQQQQHNKFIKAKHAADMDLCPIPDALTKYKPLDKIKEKDRETKNKLFAKFQVLTRYHGSAGGGGGGNGNDKKSKNHCDLAIPQENLKQLISAPSATKVTRQKNKIIIQQDSSRKN